MKKIISLFAIFVLIAHISLFAEEAGKSPATAAAETPLVHSSGPATVNNAVPSAQTGTAAAKSSHAGRTASWQNWVFAGAALVIAAIGIVAVTINSGENSPTPH